MKHETFALTLLSGIVMAAAAQAQVGSGAAQDRNLTRELNLQQVRTTPAPLNMVTIGAPAKIANANVVDPQGTPIGAVQKVEMEGSAPRRVEIAILGSGGSVTLDAAQFLYEPAQNRITANSGAGALVRMSQAQ